LPPNNQNIDMKYLLFAFFLLSSAALPAQKQALTYYLPDIEYDPAIPTPEAVLGYQIGEWHLSHDQQLYYLRQLAAASPRIVLTEYARSHEQRPLVYLTITSEANHGRLEEIRQTHVALSNPAVSARADLSAMPVVLYQGFSIHGNEPSGGNAAPLVAYYLAAGRSPEVQRTLDEAVIILDPCFNPDGFQRFSTWANMHKNTNLTDDPQDREYRETWPGGRTNHYWFDLNRDWLPAQHPESRGRLELFHRWKPNVLTDHHEMGTNATFFFMPGVPERTNPITPWKNQELTARIGEYHAAALNQIGSLYYTEEGFDDFYYGKGSTYPDANGAIGILFEQASARGHLQMTEYGPLSFPFAIRNQVYTALSTQKAGPGLRQELLEFQREFYRSALQEARADERKAYVFGDAADPARTSLLVEILRRHQIEVYLLGKAAEAEGQRFEPGQAYVVPLEQPQYRLIRGIFETMTEFQDSIFYDISSWTLPLAFGLPYASLKGRAYSPALLGEAVQGLGYVPPSEKPRLTNYAYLLEWEGYYAPKALNFLLGKDLRAQVATKGFTLDNRSFAPGTVMIPVQNQTVSAEEVQRLVEQAAAASPGLRFYAANTGLTPEGIDLGSPNFKSLQRPQVLLLVGTGVSPYEAGEVWHLLDQRYGMTVTKADLQSFGSIKLDKYTAIVMASGGYQGMASGGWDKLREWVRAGGTLIALRDGIRTAKGQGLAQVQERSKKKPDEPQQRPYRYLAADRGSSVVGGAILEAQADLSHPLLFGYQHERLPVFQQGTMALEPSKNAYATPLVYSPKPLLSGYVRADNLELFSGAAAAIVSGLGAGKTICLANNPCFRGFWLGGNRLLANSLFFGRIIESGAVERGGE
jgi:hypothetical protein